MRTLFAGILGIWFAGQLAAAEVELHLKDEQVVRGEVLAANEKTIALKTDFGVLKIPRENVANPEVLAGAPKEMPAEEPPKAAVKGGGLLDEDAILAARIKATAPARLSAKENAAIAELVGKFGDALEFERPGLLDKLRAFGAKANETVGISFRRRQDLEVRTRLIGGIALRGNAGAMPIVKETHEEALVAYEMKKAEKPDKQSFLDRGAERVLTKKELEKQAKAIADLVPELETYAAQVGGASAVLFLARTFQLRYAVSDKKDPFFDRDRDATHLLFAAVDDPQALKAGRRVPLGAVWTPGERALVIEKLIPHLASASKEYRRMLEPLLSVLLPDVHPAFAAAEADWQEWWKTARPDVLREALQAPVIENPVVKTTQEKDKPKRAAPDE
ncbi:MAG: hypothetical protein HY291_10915 [Planctomycetes bacterium]|nr:hypothetical protein [Planctomycetota bacterium]